MFWTIAAMSVVVSAIVGSAANAATPVGRPNVVGYEVAFAKAFPATGDAHRIKDWTLYASLVGGDLMGYAEQIDPTIAKRAADAKGKPYQTQQVEMSVKRDDRLIAAFNDQRGRLRAMVVYADGGGSDDCQHPLTYTGNEFRLVLGEGEDGRDPLSHATILPSCPPRLASGFQITAGRSSRFKCWPTKYVTKCGWALPDMPDDLKAVIETNYPASVMLRWRWRGIREVVHTRYADADGNRVSTQDGVALVVPDALSLEFVDAAGKVLWVASTVVATRTPR